MRKFILLLVVAGFLLSSCATLQPNNLCDTIIDSDLWWECMGGYGNEGGDVPDSSPEPEPEPEAPSEPDEPEPEGPSDNHRDEY